MTFLLSRVTKQTNGSFSVHSTNELIIHIDVSRREYLVFRPQFAKVEYKSELATLCFKYIIASR